MKREKKSLGNNDLIFSSGLFQGKEMPIQKVPGAKQILSHQLLRCVSKARSASRTRGPEVSPRLFPFWRHHTAILLKATEGIRTTARPCLPWHENPGGLFAQMARWGGSLSPSLVLSLPLSLLDTKLTVVSSTLSSHLLSDLILGCHVADQRQMQALIFTNKSLYSNKHVNLPGSLPADTFPCTLWPFLSIFLHSPCPLLWVTLSFSSLYDLCILICLKISSFSSSRSVIG